jgi:hypothetical protein
MNFVLQRVSPSKDKECIGKAEITLFSGRKTLGRMIVFLVYHWLVVDL